MSSVFETDFAASSRGVFYAIFGETAELTQGETVLQFTAIRANPADHQKGDPAAALVWAEYEEFVFLTSELGSVVPERGDTLEVAGETWRIASPDGMPVFERVDAEGKETRIFCKRKA